MPSYAVAALWITVFLFFLSGVSAAAFAAADLITLWLRSF